MDDSDALLVASASDGDKHAFGRLVMRHRAVLVALCRRMLSDPALAEDAAQEAVVAALLNLDRLRRPERFGAWLVGIGLNICRQWSRPGRRRQWAWQPLPGAAAEVADPGPTPAEISDQAAVVSLVRDAVRGLPEGQRAAVTRFYLDGLSYRESADALDIPVTALKARLHKARASLHRHLSGLREEPTVSTSQPVAMRVIDVHRLGDAVTDEHVVMLTEVDGTRRLPIWVGPYEATGLAMALQAHEPPRPFTWQLTASLLKASGTALREVRIARIDDGTFYAVIRIGQAGRISEVDARPSDAINLALVADAPITAEEAVLQTVARYASELPEHAPDTVLERATADAREIVETAMAHQPRWTPPPITDR